MCYSLKAFVSLICENCTALIPALISPLIGTLLSEIKSNGLLFFISHCLMKYFIYCRVSQEREDRQILSPESQKKELLAFAKKNHLDVVDFYSERKSAYNAGREKFNEMLKRIEKGEAQGILVHHLSRIARNSFDGGRVIYMMDQGLISEIQTKEKKYTNCSDDKFLMQIHFAMNKKSSDDNSDYVKRDTITKLEKGEYPGMAKRGYLNISKEGVISGKQYDQKKQEMLNALNRPLQRVEKDPILSPIIRKVIDLALTGLYGLNTLRAEAFKLGLTSKHNTPLSKSSLSKLLSETYYYGEFRYCGEQWWGTHETIMTRSEYDRLQGIIHNRSRPKKTKREYVFSMMIKCEDCGNLLSCDHQKGHDYLRCLKSKAGLCSFNSHLRVDELEKDIESHLASIEIPEEIVKWSLKWLKKLYHQQINQQEKSQVQLEKNIGLLKSKLISLTEKWISPDNIDGSLMSDEMFVEMKKAIQLQIGDLQESLNATNANQESWLEHCEDFFKLSKRLVKVYQRSSIQDKRLLLELIGSKYTLKGGKLHIELAKPFKDVLKRKQEFKATRTNENRLHKGLKVPLKEEKVIWQALVYDIRTFFVEYGCQINSITKNIFL